MSQSTEAQRYSEHIRSKTSRQDRYDRNSRLKAAIKEANKSLTRGDHAKAGAIARDVIVPNVQALDDFLVWSTYHAEIRDTDELQWNWPALSRFLKDPDELVTIVQTMSPRDGREARKSVLAARRTIEGAIDSLESITAYHGVTKSKLKNRVDAVGFNIKIGTHLQDPEIDFGDPVDAVTNERGPLKHLFAGGTGSGKSTCAGRQFEDYYRGSVGRGRDMKCLDPVGLGEGENIHYDIAQMQKVLRRVREDQECAPGFDAIDDFEPSAEIFVPLSPDLSEQKLPYNTETEEYVPKPFTIPASDISESLIAQIITERVSPSKENTIRDAYRAVDRRMNDWTLADLAEEIKRRDELSEKHTLDALRAIRTLQDMGFIRTHSCEHALDWDELFTSTDVITSFSQSLLEDETAQLFVVAYIIDKFWTERRRKHWYPSCCMWLRELWEIAPHQDQRRKRDDVEQAILEWIIYRLTKIMRKNRHIGAHIIGDTQEPNDVEKAVRQRFNRYVIFNANDETLEDVFSWTGKNRWYTFKSTMSEKTGEAGIIGGCGPSLRGSDIWGMAPVQLLPPSWHHHDTDKETTGWHARTKYVDAEELRRVDWETAIPDELEISMSLDDEEEADEEASHDPKEFHREEARNRCRNGESIRSIRDAIPNNPRTGNPYSTSTIQQWTGDIPHTERGQTASADD